MKVKCDLMLQIAVLEEQKKEITEIEEDDKVEEVEEDDMVEEVEKVAEEDKVEEDKSAAESSEKKEAKPDINDVPMEDNQVRLYILLLLLFFPSV